MFNSIGCLCPATPDSPCEVTAIDAEHFHMDTTVAIRCLQSVYLCVQRNLTTAKSAITRFSVTPLYLGLLAARNCDIK